MSLASFIEREVDRALLNSDRMGIIRRGGGGVKEGAMAASAGILLFQHTTSYHGSTEQARKVF